MKRLILFLLVGIFFISSLSFVSAALTNITMLNDTFESGNFCKYTTLLMLCIFLRCLYNITNSPPQISQTILFIVQPAL